MRKPPQRKIDEVIEMLDLSPTISRQGDGRYGRAINNVIDYLLNTGYLVEIAEKDRGAKKYKKSP